MFVLKDLKTAVLLPDDRVFVTRVGSGQPAGGDLQDAQPDCYEHIRLIAAAEQLVGLFQDLARAVLQPREILNDPFGQHHEQGGRYALAADIRDHQAQMVVIHKEEVIKVAADILGRIHGGEQGDLVPVRIRRENIGQHAALDLPGRGQFPHDPFLLFDEILLFHLLPFHAADRIHLPVQGQAGPVDLLLHGLKFRDRVGVCLDRLQFAFSHAGNGFPQRIELPHEFPQPETVQGQGDQEYHQGGQGYGGAHPMDHLLIILYGSFPDQSPAGKFHDCREGPDTLSALIMKDRSGIAFQDELFRITAR